MSEFVKGLCEDMCPAYEIRLRTKEHLLHFYELKPNEKYVPGKVVKAFSRSAAGVKAPRKTDLRTPRALQNTIEYLVKDIVLDKRKPYNIAYDFIFDRLRCVRQEIVIQNFDNRITIKLLEPIIFFLAYSRYRLCEEPIDKFDPKICDQHLQECLKKVLCCYDEERTGLNDSDSISTIKSREFVEAIYQMFNMGSMEALTRAIHLPKDIKNEVLTRSIQISLQYFRGNYYSALRGIEELPHIVAAVACLKLPLIREKILKIFSHAYNSKQLTVPVIWLAKILLYANAKTLLEDCKYYKIESLPEDQAVRFAKTNFNDHENPPKICHENFVEAKFKTRYLPDILLLKKI